MKQQFIFNCAVTKYRLEYIVETESKRGLLNIVLTDYKNKNPLLNLFRSSIDKLKKEGVTHIRQYVTSQDWESFLKGKTSWKIVGKETVMFIETLEIECEIDTFLENYAIGLGLFE